MPFARTHITCNARTLSTIFLILLYCSDLQWCLHDLFECYSGLSERPQWRDEVRLGSDGPLHRCALHWVYVL
ncbi:hypothetical protein C8Q73DRAFT_133129 [Cubamyces lactineus]|nr:hypothetical protein C8Q73DRAFT_133129 [Cubamyces lactineus]